jgi:hypothetical protein
MHVAGQHHQTECGNSNRWRDLRGSGTAAQGGFSAAQRGWIIGMVPPLRLARSEISIPLLEPICRCTLQDGFWELARVPRVSQASPAARKRRAWFHPARGAWCRHTAMLYRIAFISSLALLFMVRIAISRIVFVLWIGPATEPLCQED